MFINTREFSREANYYDKHGRYDDGEYNSRHWLEYWRYQKQLCKDGYSVGGVKITGRHYFYLNFCPIERVIKTTLNGKTREDREFGFPRFWDEDYNFYHVKDIARFGISEKEYKELNLDVIIKPEHLVGRKHIIWLKPRGVGASYKGGAEGAYNYFLLKKSKTFYLASTTQYLTNDGILNKFIDVRDFINSYRYNKNLGVGTHGFYQGKVKADMEKMHFKNGRLGVDGTTIVGGKQSEVFGVNLNGDYNKARGKRGVQIHFEEFGNFKDADAAWLIARPSVEEGDSMFGQLIGWGTGGTEGEGFAAMEKMFYDTETYNCIGVENIWDEGALGTFAGYFTPAYRDIGFTDENGNSLTDKAKAHYDSLRAIAEKSPDGSNILKTKAEKPYCPREATLITSGNPFLSAELLEHITELKNKRLRAGGVLGIPADLIYTPEGVKHTLSEKKPIPTYPITKDDSIRVNLEGVPVIYEIPYKDPKTGQVPPNLYYICNDPYSHDNSLDKSNLSLGASYVIERMNTLTKTKGGIIVASYVGRPKTQDTYNDNLFKLAQYYNAKVASENNTGDTYGYAKRNKLLNYMEKQFTLAYDSVLATKNGMQRTHSMHITGERKKTGLLYLRDWLYEVIANDEESGKPIYRLHTIIDIPLLEEFAKFNDVGNFDRVSALLIGMFQDKEYTYQNKKITNSLSTIESIYLNLQKNTGNIFKI